MARRSQSGITIHRETQVKSGRPLQRVFIDLTGPYPPSAGGARYCMLVVGDNTNVGWPLFLRDKSGPTLYHTFRAWHNAVKLVAATYGGFNIGRFDNAHEFTNAEFRKLLTELGIAVEYTPVDGDKRDDRVKRKLALTAEGAKAAWLEFLRHFPDLEFPKKALSGQRSGRRRLRGWTTASIRRRRHTCRTGCARGRSCTRGGQPVAPCRF